jgi:hypothetical protein
MGAVSTASSSATINSSARSYCPPGDTGTCNPPVAEWKMDENTNQTFYDTSNNNLFGTLGADTSVSSSDPTWSPGHSGGALRFDGSNDYLRVADDNLLTPGGDMTFSMWFKLDTLPTDTGITYYLFVNSDTTAPYHSYYCYVNDDSSNDIECRWTNSGRTESNTAGYTASLSVDTWYYLTFVKSGTTIYVYVNGVQNGYSGTNATGTILNSDYPLYFGGNVPASNMFFDGQMDDAKLYNYARTPAQIAWDYNNGGPLAFWRFDEGNGDVVHNSSEFESLTNGDLAGSGGSCPGAASCPTWTTNGKVNSALDYDSTNDYINAGSDASIDNFFSDGGSVSAWIKADTFGESSLGRIADKGGASSSSGWGFSVCNDGSNCTNSLLLFQGFSGTSDFWWTTPNNTISTGVWTHVVVTYNNNSVSNDPIFYINGVKKNTLEPVSSSGSANSDSSNDLYIGNRSDNDRTFDGVIDDLKIWNYELTPEQVKMEYNQGSAVRY